MNICADFCFTLLFCTGLYNEGGNPDTRAKELQEAGFELLFLTLSLSTLNPVSSNKIH